MQWVTLAVRPSAVRELLAATSSGMVTLVVPGVQSEQPGEGEPDGEDEPEADTSADDSPLRKEGE